MVQSTASPSDTRDALIKAGLLLFGEKGFDATSTRELAASAGVNIASISYHFGGKEGLRAACGDFIAATMRDVLGRAFDVDAAEAPTGLTSEAARDRLARLCDLMNGVLNEQGEGRLIVPFMLRELMAPGDVLETIYARMIEPVHKRLCRLWADATGMGHDDPETLLSVFSLVGQVVYFALARRIVSQRMGWAGIHAQQAGEISSVLRNNLDAMLEKARHR